MVYNHSFLLDTGHWTPYWEEYFKVRIGCVRRTKMTMGGWQFNSRSMTPVPESLCQSYHCNDVRPGNYHSHRAYFRHTRRKNSCIEASHPFLVAVNENHFPKSRFFATQWSRGQVDLVQLFHSTLKVWMPSIITWGDETSMLYYQFSLTSTCYSPLTKLCFSKRVQVAQ